MNKKQDNKSTKISVVKLSLMPGKANPAPPVGSVLGQRGVNIMQFCKEFNDLTKSLDPSLAVTAVISIKPDKSFSLEIKKPSMTSLIKKKMNIKSGSKEPGKNIIAKISMSDIISIAEEKIVDTNAMCIDAAIKMVIGTARSMGILVENS